MLPGITSVGNSANILVFRVKTEIITTSTSWTVPSSIGSATFIAIGEGGVGSEDFVTTAGGGGGACAGGTINVVPGEVLTLNIGPGRDANIAGQFSSVSRGSTVLVQADFGQHASGGGTGGRVANCIGTFSYNGGDGSSTSSRQGSSASGGGAAGNLGSASGKTAGASTTFIDSNGNTAKAGSGDLGFYGRPYGAGGGAYRDGSDIRTVYNAAPGVIIIQYTVATTELSPASFVAFQYAEASSFVINNVNAGDLAIMLRQGSAGSTPYNSRTGESWSSTSNNNVFYKVLKASDIGEVVYSGNQNHFITTYRNATGIVLRGDIQADVPTITGFTKAPTHTGLVVYFQNGYGINQGSITPATFTVRGSTSGSLMQDRLYPANATYVDGTNIVGQDGNASTSYMMVIELIQ